MTRRCPAPSGLMLVALLAVSVPLIPAPVSDPHWHGLRTGAFEAGSALLLSFLLARSWTEGHPNGWAQTLRAAPLRFLVAFLLWGCLSAFLAPAKPFAWQGLLQLGAGVLIALTVAVEARETPQSEFLLTALTAATLLISVSGFALYGQGSDQLAVGLYHDHQLYGAVFTILLPLMLALGISPRPAAHRLTAQAALLGGVIALGLSETRSSWIGLVAAGFMFLGLSLWAQRFTPRSRNHLGGRARLLLLPTITALGALTYLLIVLPQTGHIMGRMRTLFTTVSRGKEESVEWRLLAWQGARQMIRQKPGIGWGIGCYPCCQHAFTHQGDSDAQVLAHGPTLPDEAHDSYLQIAVETGLPGLCLWLGVLVSTFAGGVRALRRLTADTLRQRMLIGCLSALIGQAVDAVANPGWQFGEVSLFLWIVLGLTVALSLQTSPASAAGSPESRLNSPPPLGLRAGAFMLSLTVGAGLLWVILHTLSVLPAPVLSLAALLMR